VKKRLRCRTTVLVAAALAALTAGCGSVVPLDSSNVAGNGAVGSGGTGASGTGGAANGAPGALGTTGGGQVAGSSSLGSSGSASSTGSLGGGTTAAGGQAAGGASSNAPIRIGIAYLSSTSEKAFLGAAGGDAENSSDPGDAHAQAQASIDWVNKNGGLAGHQIIPVYFQVDLTSNETYVQEQQDACALWTQTNHVVAGFWFLHLVSLQNIATCLGSHHALFAQGGVYGSQFSDYTKNPFYLGLEEVTGERMAARYVDALQSQGYFSSTAQTGIITYDNDAGLQRTLKYVKAELSRRHLPLRDTYTVTEPGATTDLGTTVSQIQTGAARFNAEHIDHVISLLPFGLIEIFMSYADQQQYRPRYGLTTYDAPWLDLQIGGLAPADQLANAVGLGWEPDLDVDAAHDPGGNPSAKKCEAILGSTARVRSQREQGGTYCDYLLMLYTAASHLPKDQPLTGDVLLAAVNALGSSYQSAMNLGTTLTQARHDAVSTARPFKYDQSCSCFTYSLPAESLT
jgi:hypothetical protein